MHIGRAKKQGIPAEAGTSGNEQSKASLLSRKLLVPILAVGVSLSSINAISQTLAKVDNKGPTDKVITYTPPDKKDSLNILTPPDTAKKMPVAVNQYADVSKMETKGTTTTSTSVVPSNNFVGKNFTAELGDDGLLTVNNIKVGKNDTVWKVECNIKKFIQRMGLPENTSLSETNPTESVYNGLLVLYLSSDTVAFQLSFNLKSNSVEYQRIESVSGSEFIDSDLLSNGLMTKLSKDGISFPDGWFDFAKNFGAGFTVSDEATLTSDKNKTPNILELKDPKNPLFKDDQGILKIKFDFTSSVIKWEVLGDD